MPDLKITQLPAEASPTLADLVPIVVDALSSPVTKHATLEDVLALASGGNVTYNSAYASPPASPNSGDLWFPPDSPYSLFGGLRYSGSAWVPTNGMTIPVDGDFAWINQGGASVDASKGGIYLSEGATAGINWRIRKKAAPTPPYTITAAFLSNMMQVDDMAFGLIYRQSSDGKLAVNVIQCQSDIRRHSGYFTNPTTFAGNGSANVNTDLPGLAWLRIADDNTNRIMSYSADGQNWLPHSTLGRTAFLTADEVGFAINVNNGSYGMGATLLHWKET